MLQRRQFARLCELDALRGLAALLVLLHHGWATLPRAPTGGLEAVDWLLENTPLRLLALGRPAVIFFFVLSGYVLVRALMLRPTPWPIYAMQRTVRLGPPVVASVFVSWLLWQLTWNGPLPEDLPGFTGATWNEVPTPAALVQQALLLNTDPQNGLNPVLWSLVHEWRIGLLLPLALLARAWPSALILSGFLVSAVAVLTGVEVNAAFLGPDMAHGLLHTLYFLLPFAAGATLALAGWPRPLRQGAPVLLGLAVLVATMFAQHDLVSIAGAVLLIVLALQPEGIGDWLRRPLPLWLGRISFSLYLIHLPVLTALLHLLAETVPVPAILAVALLASLGAAVLLHRWCELPAQRLARSLTPAGIAVRPGLRLSVGPGAR